MYSDSELSNVVVRIRCGGDLGTAFYIKKDILLTAFHVVKKYKEEKIEIINDVLLNDVQEGKIVSMDKENDVVLLKIHKPKNISSFLSLNSYLIPENAEWRSYTCFEGFQGTGNIFEKELIRGKVYQNEDFAKKI